MDYKKYGDIAPYLGEDVERAKERLIAHREYLGAFAMLIAGNNVEMINPIIDMIYNGVSQVHSYDEFQRNVTAGIFIPAIIKKTTTSFTFSGLENLDPSKGYLFISNH